MLKNSLFTDSNRHMYVNRHIDANRHINASRHIDASSNNSSYMHSSIFELMLLGIYLSIYLSSY
jgi:hypothetical protein